MPKGWERLLAPVAMVWGRLDRLAARLTVQRAVRYELRALDGLFGPGKGMAILGDRLRRRAAEQGRRPVTDPVGWLIGRALPRRVTCGDLHCDEGRRMDTGASCERCAEHLGDLLARRREVGVQLASALAGNVPAEQYRRQFEAGLREATRQAERQRAVHREQAARERAQREEDLAACRAEQGVLEEQERARPCGVCGRARSGGLCESCSHARAAQSAVAEVVEISLATRGFLGATAPGVADFIGRLEAEARAHIEEVVHQAVVQGATQLTASVLRKLAAQEQLEAIRQEALAVFGAGPEARAEAKAAFEARMRRWHLHDCDGQHDCHAFVREDAAHVAEKVRLRTAKHLLEQRLAVVRAARAAPLAVMEPDPYTRGAARVRAAMVRPRAEASA
ncbi:hypothetical protein [Streptomyces syringium]|uniref:hypothetical protein n=1 Tax=Streptomyces syringium TaxID=76729 RepID=UPI00340AAB58